MNSSDIDTKREVLRLTLEAVADARREYRAKEAERDEKTAKQRAALEKALKPFLEPLAELAKTEAELLGYACDAAIDFAKARREELLAGRECRDADRPPGVSIRWLDRPTVPDLEALDPEFVHVAADMAAIKERMKAEPGKGISGVVIVRTPSIVVEQIK